MRVLIIMYDVHVFDVRKVFPTPDTCVLGVSLPQWTEKDCSSGKYTGHSQVFKLVLLFCQTH